MNELQFFTFFFLHLFCKIVCLLFRPSALVASLCLIVLVVGSFLFLRLTSYALWIGVDTDEIPLDAALIALLPCSSFYCFSPLRSVY